MVPDMSSIKRWAGGGPDSSSRRPPQSHPVVPLKTNGSAASQKMALITLTHGITGPFPDRCLEIFICALPTSKYVRNFNKEEETKKSN